MEVGNIREFTSLSMIQLSHPRTEDLRIIQGNVECISDKDRQKEIRNECDDGKGRRGLEYFALQQFHCESN